jgi:hypothetical protein
MARFTHIRHKPPETLATPRELVVAVPPMRSHVNLSHIVRTCGCFGIPRVIATGAAGLHGKIARDGAEHVAFEVHRSLAQGVLESSRETDPAKSLDRWLARNRASLTPRGRLVLAEFRGEDPAVPIKPLHKMTKRQVRAELEPAGFQLAREFDRLPWQHLLFFRPGPARPPDDDPSK